MTGPSALFRSPEPAPWLAPYWEGIAAHELRLPRCSVCGRWEWYPQPSGPACAGARYEWVAIAPGATLFTFTRVARPLLPDAAEPYVTGLVVPDDAPDVRLAARIVGDPDDVRIGARATLAFSGEGADSFPYFIVEKRS